MDKFHFLLDYSGPYDCPAIEWCDPIVERKMILDNFSAKRQIRVFLEFHAVNSHRVYAVV